MAPPIAASKRASQRTTWGRVSQPQRVGPHLRRVRAATDEREADRVGRLEVGQALQHERARAGAADGLEDALRGCVAAGQPPSGDAAGGWRVRLNATSATTIAIAATGPSLAAALVDPRSPEPDEGRDPEPDGDEHDRVDERVVVVVREAAARPSPGRSRRPPERGSPRRASARTSGPANRSLADPRDRPARRSPRRRPAAARIAATGASVSRPVSGQPAPAGRSRRSGPGGSSPTARHRPPGSRSRRGSRRSRVEASWIASGT